MPLQGKTALVTGGSRGIGKAIALELAQRGCSVAITFLRNGTRAREVVDELNSLTDNATAIRCNIGDASAIESMVLQLKTHFRQLDVLVNNAASGVMRNVIDTEVKHWDWTLNVNSRGAWLITKYASTLMPGGGRIVNVSSPGAVRVFPSYFPVGVSKAAMEAVTRYSAVQLAGQGISVNAVSPGFVVTDALDAFPEELGVKEIAQEPTPAGRPVNAQDVANVVAMLCGPDSAMIQGQVIAIDGGQSLRFVRD